MEKKDLDFATEATRELLDAPTCCAEAREAAQRWLDAIGTPTQEGETKKYIAELEEDIMPIETLIQFATSQEGAAYFGADTAAGIAAHGKELAAAGAKYCDCPACAAAEKILSVKDKLLA